MIACLSIPGFELKAALRRQPSLATRPAALAPEAGAEPLLGPVTAAAEAAGVVPRMRLGEALATCPALVLVEPDPAAAELAWEEIVRALEDAGFSVEPAALGVAYFETRGVERLYGGLEPALKRALAATGAQWDARIGAAGRRFAALSPPRRSRGRGSCSSSATTRSGGSSRPCRCRSCRSSGSATTSSKHWEYESSDSLPGFRVAPSPNDWGRTAGAPGAWREAEHPRACAAAVHPRSSWRRSSSPRRSGTSSRFAARSARSSRRRSRGRSGATGSSARSRSAHGSSAAAPGGAR